MVVGLSGKGERGKPRLFDLALLSFTNHSRRDRWEGYSSVGIIPVKVWERLTWLTPLTTALVEWEQLVHPLLRFRSRR